MSMDDTQYNKEIINNVDKIHGYTPAWAIKRDHTGRINCKHITARELRQIVGHRIWDEYYKFSFVRNPYDKLLSEYSMFTQFEAFILGINTLLLKNLLCPLQLENKPYLKNLIITI
jgi:hypothetical protein